MKEKVSIFEYKNCLLCNSKMIWHPLHEYYQCDCTKRSKETPFLYRVTIGIKHSFQDISIGKYSIVSHFYEDNSKNITDIYLSNPYTFIMHMPLIIIDKNTDFSKLEAKMDMLRTFK